MAELDQLDDSEIQFKRLVEDTKDLAIFMISTEGIIKSWNEGATRIKQFTREDVIGNHFRMLYTEEDRALGRPEHNLQMTIEYGRFQEQWWRIRKDGTRWWADCILSGIYSPQGKLIGISKFVRDMTEKKKTDDDLRDAKKAAEEANLRKSAFVANMSHEIRTPLGAILGFSDMLLEPDLSIEERIECGNVIKRNGKVLLRLIEDILDISKIEAGKLELEYIEIPIRSQLAEVVALFEVRAKKKGIALNLEVESAVPDYITSDSVRLRQIVSNLIGNAIKFTDSGQVRVSARSMSRKIKGIEILVSDTGPGIPEDKRDRLFAKFTQADSSITRKFGGTGLGLALSRDLALKLGGDIELLNSASGCTFRIEIPSGTPSADIVDRQKEVRASQSSQNDTRTYPHLDGSKVLLVEDSADNQKLIKRILTKAGADVVLANNGAEGVEAASSADFDAVLMDVQMPVLDGNSATSRLRNAGYDRPIIALTAHAMIEDRMVSMRAGCDDYLTKPINSLELLHVLEKWVQRTH